MKNKIIILAVAMSLLMTGCASNKSKEKYSDNKFVTSEGTTYINNDRNYLGMIIILLKPSGIGSCCTGDFSYEFNYYIEVVETKMPEYTLTETILCLPNKNGNLVYFKCDIDVRDGLRKLTYSSFTWTEMNPNLVY